VGWLKKSESPGRDYMKKKLSEVEFNETGIVSYIDEKLKNRIDVMGIRVGKKLKMVTKQPIKGPVVVIVEGANTSLGLDLAQMITLEVD
jgi:ferrous iron transport protein A